MTLLAVTVNNRINKSISTSAGNRTNFYRRAIHTIGSGDVSGFYLAYDGWFGNYSNGQVVNVGNDYMITRSGVECNGVWAPVTFSSARNTTIVNGAVKYLSDLITPEMFGLDKFALGTDFWTKEDGYLADVSHKIPYGLRYISDYSGSQMAFYDPSLLTLSNIDAVGPYTVTGTVNSTSQATVALMGAPIVLGNFIGGDKPVRMCKGDSQSEGTGSVSAWKYGRSWFNRAQTNEAGNGGWMASINFAVHGSTSELMKHSAAIEAYDAHTNSLVLAHGYNNIGLGGTGDTASQMTTKQQELRDRYKANVPSGKVAVLQLGPRADSTDSWVTEEFQTPLAAFTGIAAAYNSGLSTSGFDQILTCNSVRGVDSTKFKVDGTARAYAYDNTHWADKSQIAVANENRSRLALLDPVSTSDTTPDAFSFTPAANVALSTVSTSNTITVGGINAASAISVTGGEYSINGGAWTSASGTVTSGQTVAVRRTSSASNSTAATVTLTIGGISATYTVTTLEAVQSDTTPNAFSFSHVTGAGLSETYTSNPITVTGITAAAGISISNGEYRINNGSWTSVSGLVSNADTVSVRRSSSGSNSTTVSTALNIGGVAATFSITTVAGSVEPVGIASTSMKGTGARSMPMATLDASGTLSFSPGKSQILLIVNGTSGELTPRISGSEANEIEVKGVGYISLSSGYQCRPIPPGENVAIPLISISSYLKGDITITGAAGAKACILEF